MFHKLVIVLLYATGHRDADTSKHMYFLARPVVESCLNVHLDDWFQNAGITHTFATLVANKKMPEVEVGTLIRDIVGNQLQYDDRLLTEYVPAQQELSSTSEKRLAELFTAVDQCQTTKQTYRSLKRRFRDFN